MKCSGKASSEQLTEEEEDALGGSVKKLNEDTIMGEASGKQETVF